MTANRIIHHIFNQPDLRQVDQASLEQLVEKYPYFAAARMLLARKEFTDRKDLTAAALKKAQLYSNTPQQVHQFVTTPLSETVFETVFEPVAAPAQPADIKPAVAETGVSAEDQAILDELAAEDARNAALVEAQPPVEEEKKVKEPQAEVEEEKVEEPQAEIEIEEEKIEEPQVEIEEEKVEEPQAEIEIEEEKIEEPQAEIEIEEEKTEEPQAEIEIEEEKIEEPQAEIEIEEEKIEEPQAEEEEKLQAEIETEEKKIEEAQAEAEIDEQTQRAQPEEDDEDRAIAAKYDEFLYAEKAPEPLAAVEQDEIVAIDYEAEKASAEFEAARTSDAPDEIVAIDYEAEKAAAEFEAARTQRAPDDIIAIDYDAIREETEAEQYEPEPEEEEIVVETAAAEGTGLTLPAAINGEGHAETGEAPIRIHPMDTPVEETVLTFQPLYTDDYFAYKKLKDPNSAEMMNEKAAAEMRSFTDWLRELKDNFAGKSAKDWYHQQMNKLYEDDEPEVSERVEKMAMESITLNDDIVSETLAEIWVRQHQHGKAIAVYQKLSLLNPDKNAYFAQKIKDLQLLTDNNK